MLAAGGLVGVILGARSARDAILSRARSAGAQVVVEISSLIEIGYGPVVALGSYVPLVQGNWTVLSQQFASLSSSMLLHSKALSGEVLELEPQMVGSVATAPFPAPCHVPTADLIRPSCSGSGPRTQQIRLSLPSLTTTASIASRTTAAGGTL